MKFLLTGNLSVLARSVGKYLGIKNHQVFFTGLPDQSDFAPAKNFKTFPQDLDSQKRFFDAHSFDCVVYIATQEGIEFIQPEKWSPPESVNLEQVLSSSHKTGMKRVIYISSVYIYGDSSDTSEDKPPSSNSLYGQLLTNEENICRYFSSSFPVQIDIVRVSNIYGPEEKNSFLNQLMKKARTNGNIELNVSEIAPCHFLHIEDFLDFIGQLVEDEGGNGLDVYNLSAEDINYSFLQQLVGYAIPGTQFTFSASEGNPPPQRSINCAQARKKYNWKPKHNLIHDVQNLSRESTELIDNEKSGNIFQSLKPFLNPLLVWGEVILGAFLMHFLTIWTDTLIEFKYIDYRLLYVVLIGSTHGLFLGILSALLACLSILVKWYSIGLDWALIIYNVENWIPFALLFLAGSVTGYQHDKKENEISFEKHQTTLIHEKYEFLYKLYDEISTLKNQLRDQLVGYRDSFGRFFKVTNELNELDADQVFIKAIDVLQDLMKNDQIAIYSIEPAGNFGRLEVKSKSIHVKIPKSINLNTDYLGVLDLVHSGKIFQNKELDTKYPAYIAPIMENDTLIGLVMLWEASFEQFSMYYLNLFRITTGLVQSALVRAAAFQNIQRDKQFLPGTSILRPEAFRKAVELRKIMRRKKIADYLILSIQKEEGGWAHLYETLSRGVRDEDIIGVLDTEDSKCYVLLNHAEIQHLDLIQERISKLGLQSEYLTEIQGL